MNTIPVTSGAPIPLTALRRLAGVLVPVGFTTILADFLFWGGHWGLSFGVFITGLAILILTKLDRPRVNLSIVSIVVLLGASVWQSCVQISLSNLIACSVLLVALAGNVFHTKLAGQWSRISEVAYGLITAPFRWAQVGVTGAKSFLELRMPGFDTAALLAKSAWVFGPMVVLLLLFTGIFAVGNSVFATFLTDLSEDAMIAWDILDLSPLRVFCWALVATFALGIFHGTPAPDTPRWWTGVFPRIVRPDFKLAALQSGAILVGLNGLFFLVNTLDAIYLWDHGSLPVGTNRSDSVHEGIYSLIFAVLLSAAIIGAIFQQEDCVANHRWLRVFSYVWIVQNFVLIAGCLLRLKFYTADYMLTEKRVYVVCFLALCGVGFLLLGWFVFARKTFNWLFGSSCVAAVTLFFLLQFANVAGFVAEYNVSLWQRDDRRLDVGYVASLGPGAWPFLVKLAGSENQEIAGQSRRYIEAILGAETDRDWRALQIRRDRELVMLQQALGK